MNKYIISFKKMKKKKMHKFLVCACKSQDFAQNQKKIALSHNRTTGTFKSSDYNKKIQHLNNKKKMFKEFTFLCLSFSFGIYFVFKYFF